MACSPWVESGDDTSRWLVAAMRSNASGNLRVTVDPAYGETAMLTSFEPAGVGLSSHLRQLEVGPTIPYLAVTETDESNRYSRSGAAFVNTTTTLNWPIREADDGPLLPLEHRFTVGIVDEGRQYVQGEAWVGVFLKRDLDPNAGSLRVNLVFAVRPDQELSDGVDRALQVWRDLYAPIGIELDVQQFEVDHPRLLGPGRGDADIWKQIATDTRQGVVNVVVVEEIEGTAGLLGYAGSIPGPLLPTGLSAVAVSSTLAAGPDGVFSEPEIDLLGETMAHEVGHYLGLFHPVESNLLKWDSLDDTPDCSVLSVCEAELGGNLMFPYPLDCSSPTGCRPQRQITAEQASVANGYAGVR